MRVVLGIGNPGARYQATRHNVGFRVVEAVARRGGAAFERLSRLPGDGAARSVGDRGLLLVKPLTYVNRCGTLLAALRERHGLPLEGLLVVLDDFHLALGRLRLRGAGGDGGHNGLRSVIEALGTDECPRLRLGIGSPGQGEAAEHVLAPFSEGERPAVERAVEAAADAVELWARLGLEEAVDQANRRDLDRGGKPA